MSRDPAPATGPPPARAQLLRWVRRGYVALLVGVVAYLLLTSGDDLRAATRGADPLRLALVPVAALGQIVLTSVIWTVGLRGFGVTVPLPAVVATTAAAAPARYLPGSVWFAATRVTMLRRRGAPARALSTVAGLETLLVPVVGFGLGSTLLALTGAGAGLAGTLSLPLLVVGLVLLGLCTPPVVNRLLRLRVREGEPLLLTWAGLGRLLLCVAAFWGWSAGVFALYLSAFPGVTDAGPVTVAAAYMVAWGIGWLAPFAPQGVGVFEVALVALVGGSSGAVVVVLGGYRALIAVRDVAAAGLAALALRRSPAADPR